MISKKYFLVFAILSAKTGIYSSEKSAAEKVESFPEKYSCLLEYKVVAYPRKCAMIQLGKAGFVFEKLESEEFTKYVVQSTESDRQKALKEAFVGYNYSLKNFKHFKGILSKFDHSLEDVHGYVTALLIVGQWKYHVANHKAIIDCLKQHGAKEEQ